MNPTIDTIKKTRQFLLNLVNDVTIDQLNEVPPGFNNNIIWNLAHMIAAQQGVCYLRAGQKTHVPEEFYLPYKTDTKPEGFLDSSEIEKIKGLLFTTLDQLEEDYNANLFANYHAWTNRYGTTLSNIDEAVQFLLFHEGLHTGYIMALKRTVKNARVLS